MPLSFTDGDRDHVTWDHFGQSDSGVEAVGHNVDKPRFRDELELHIAGADRLTQNASIRAAQFRLQVAHSPSMWPGAP
jgi:hypothetical protein